MTCSDDRRSAYASGEAGALVDRMANRWRRIEAEWLREDGPGMGQIAEHVGHRITATRWPNDRAEVRCEDCDVVVNTGSTIPLTKPGPQDWPQVVTGVIRERDGVGLCVQPEGFCVERWHFNGANWEMAG